MTGKAFTHTEHAIIDLVARSQNRFCTSYEMLIPNCYTQYDNEADAFAVRRSGLCDEFEIKVTRSDFLNDAKKIVHYREYEYCPNATSIDSKWDNEHRHLTHNQRGKLVAPWQKLKYDALQSGNMATNYFWYILKDGIATAEEVPPWAGLCFVSDEGELSIVRQPKRLHAGKLTFEDRYKLARKCAYRFWDYRLGLR